MCLAGLLFNLQLCFNRNHMLKAELLITEKQKLAIHQGGKIGSTCIKWSFEYALVRLKSNKLLNIKGLI